MNGAAKERKEEKKMKKNYDQGRYGREKGVTVGEKR